MIPASRLSPAERATRGRQARREVPRSSHVELTAVSRDPVAVLEAQATSRVPELVPVRYGRMLVSPFTFYRGAAALMAMDLATTPVSGLRVQLCGDAHLSNFGMFGSPERRLVFDINDFDETLPGPWEWDVKRLAVSVEVAARENGLPAARRRRVVLACLRSYREAMRSFAGMTNLALWYTHLDADTLAEQLSARLSASRQARLTATFDKARTRDSTQAVAKLTRRVEGEPRIVADPPLVVPARDLLPDVDRARLVEWLDGLLLDYRATLPSDRQVLVEQYRAIDIARKVVGVGSVGTRAWVILMQGRDDQDLLFLQAKEAQASVLAPFAGASRFQNQGRRVVAGQRLMQAAGDIFLGWQRTLGIDGQLRDFYVRQLRDWKMSTDVGSLAPKGLSAYGQICGWTLARAHARTGDRIAIAAYLGSGDVFDRAVADFSAAYADQNERDHAALADAVASGRVEATSGV